MAVGRRVETGEGAFLESFLFGDSLSSHDWLIYEYPTCSTNCKNVLDESSLLSLFSSISPNSFNLLSFGTR